MPNHFNETQSSGQLSDQNIARPVKRRQFLQTISVVAIGLSFFPKHVFAQYDEVGAWRDIVSQLVYTIADCNQATAINDQLSRTSLYPARQATTFHDRFSARLVFGRPPIDPQLVVCENGFEVKRLPFYDRQSPCRDVNDLNAAEIIRITDDDEIRRFGCVITPEGERTPVNSYDHAKYRELAPHYGLDHTEWEVPYKRPVTGKRRNYTGFHIVHKTQNKTDFIVSGDI